MSKQNPRGASGGGEDKRLKKNVEFLLLYVKNRDSDTALDLNQAFDETELTEHIDSMRDEGKSWNITAVTDFGQRPRCDDGGRRRKRNQCVPSHQIRDDSDCPAGQPRRE